MIREFFASGAWSQRALAWGGAFAFVAHAFYKAWLTYALNEWYRRFYDELQSSAGELVIAGCAEMGSGGSGESGGSGDSGDTDDIDALQGARQRIVQQLVQFALIVAPSVVVHPTAKWLADVWRFTWRVALVRSYLAHYDVTLPAVEGASQRIHEDTQRFERGMYGCATMVLDALLTIVVFVPVLYEAGASTHPNGLRWPPWLVTIALGTAVVGFGVSVLVARRLVYLEIENQRVEARLRTRLVLLEQMPDALMESYEPFDPTGDAAVTTSVIATTSAQRTRRENDANMSNTPLPTTPRRPAMGTADMDVLHIGCPEEAWRVGPHFRALLIELWENYKRLFSNFAVFNLWIAAYGQTMTIVPYALVAPLVFAGEPADRITLGTMIKVTNAFDKVFGALSILTENWASVNEFRSTVRRLREFERSTYARKKYCAERVRTDDDDRGDAADHLYDRRETGGGLRGRRAPTSSLPTEVALDELPGCVEPRDAADAELQQ